MENMELNLNELETVNAGFDFWDHFVGAAEGMTLGGLGGLAIGSAVGGPTGGAIGTITGMVGGSVAGGICGSEKIADAANDLANKIEGLAHKIADLF